MTPSIHEIVETFGAVVYQIPKLGEHGTFSCLFGKHWLTLLRSEKSNQPLAVACGACRKLFGPIRDIGIQSQSF